MCIQKLNVIQKAVGYIWGMLVRHSSFFGDNFIARKVILVNTDYLLTTFLITFQYTQLVDSVDRQCFPV